MTAVLNDISEGPVPEPVPNHDRGLVHPVQTLGELLRSKREALGITSQQAAEQLRLLPHWIEAFETNRFESLVAPVYSRGYLRKYALLLDLPPDEILARYEKLHDIPAAPPLAPIKPTASPPLRTTRAPAWLGAVALVSVAAVLVLVKMEPDPSQAGSDMAPQVVATMSTVAAPPAPVSVTAPASTPEASAVEAAATIDAAAVPVSTEGGASEAASSDAAVAAPPAAESTLTPVSVETPTATPAPTSEPAPAAAVPEEPLARVEVPMARGGRNLNVTLSFKGKSWATVYAADGKRLLYELGRRGRPRMVSSPPPLTVVVGAIDAVELRVNDKQVMIPRQPGKDSIKFILDVESNSRDTRSAAAVGSGG
jgi:cytoskeleton protein RodZ